VDRNGQIFIPRVGTLTIAGIRYDQLESYIHSAIANLYKDFELNVTMGQLRSIQIFDIRSGQCAPAWRLHGKFAKHARDRSVCFRRPVGIGYDAPYRAAPRKSVHHGV
jgi:hypothetical protein